MPAYANLGGNSNIASYEPGEGSFLVRFKGGWEYVWTTDRVGANVIRDMVAFGRAGRGLANYIHRRAKHTFSSKTYRPSGGR